ncbi:LacI family DNA-binding transcriptional regulator [Mesorhizobium sp. 1B3]|uniref:LacI family DNA-binding transcriptional regulator n=1 Tax=Mesorhizobium sp. 1B3 TaxID=3243599 RepID=UPI003D967374
MSLKSRIGTRRPERANRMEDIAAAAGVSLATVSRVFSQPEMVSEATREKVHAVAKRMRYLPNLLAGSMAANQSRVISAMVPVISSAIFAQTIEGLSSGLHGTGYELMLSQSGYDPEQEYSILRAFLGRRADGIVIAGAITDPRCRELLLHSDTPVVEMWELFDNPIDMAVGFSNYHAAQAAAEYLLGQGYRKFGFIGGTDQRTAARKEGFYHAVQAAGLPSPREVLIQSPSHSSFAAGGQAVGRLLEGNAGMDVVFCTNDLLAVGALFECQRRGLSVPEHVAVMGFSDLDIGQVSVPPLTTVQVGAYEIGRRTSEMLLGRLTGSSQKEKMVDTGFSIVRRQSA